MLLATGTTGRWTGRSRLATLTSISRGMEVSQAMTNLYEIVASLVGRDEDGQGLAEYALILALIAVVAVVAVVFLGGQLSQTLSSIGESVERATR